MLLNLISQQLYPKTYSRSACLIFLQVAFVLVAAVTTFYLFLREPIGSDDCSYFAFAGGFQPSYANSNGQRLGLVGAIKLFQSLFGYSAYAYYGTALVAYTGLLLSTFFLIKTFISTPAGLLAVLWIMAEPSFLINATLLLPEISALFWLVLGIATFVYSFEQQHSRLRQIALASLSALFVMMSVLTKETFALILPAMLIYPLSLGKVNKRKTSVVYFIGTGLCLGIIERVIYWYVFDDPFHRLNTVLGHHVRGVKEVWVERGLVATDLTWLDLANRFFLERLDNPFYNLHLLFGLNYYAWLFIFALCAIGLVLYLRSPLLTLLVSLSIISWATISLPVAGLDPLLPLLRTKARYFIPVSAFLSILIPAAFLETLKVIRRSTKAKSIYYKLLEATVYLFLVAFPLYYLVQWRTGFDWTVHNSINLMHNLRDATFQLKEKELPINRITGRYKTIRAATFFLPHEKVVYTQWLDNSEPIGPGDVVVDHTKYFTAPEQSAYWIQIAEGGHKRGLFGVYYGLSSRTLASKKTLLPAYSIKRGTWVDGKTPVVPLLKLNKDTFTSLKNHGHLLFAARMYSDQNKVRSINIDLFRLDSKVPIRHQLSPWKDNKRSVFKWVSPLVKPEEIEAIDVSATFWNGFHARIDGVRMLFTEQQLPRCISCSTPDHRPNDR